MNNNWLLRMGDGDHFRSSSKFNTWGINSKVTCCKGFIRDAKAGDKLWFVKSKSHGKIMYVAELVSFKPRELGPLIAVTQTNEELGWTKQEGDWDTEVHYSDLYDVSSLDFKSEIKSPLTIRLYNSEKCKVNLPFEYQNIVKYCKVIKIS